MGDGRPWWPREEADAVWPSDGCTRLEGWREEASCSVATRSVSLALTRLRGLVLMTGSVLTLLIARRWARSLRVVVMAMKRSKERLSPLPGAPNIGDSRPAKYQRPGSNTGG